MRKINLSGAIPALVTPFNDDKSVDFSSLRNLIDFQIENGVSGLVLCGTTGEGATIKPEEYSEIIKTACERVKGRVPIIVGTGSNDTKKAISLSQTAEKAGADALLVVTPYYNKPTPNGLIEHYQKIAEAVGLPIILYNVPSRTGCNLTPETVFKILERVPEVIAIKEASGNLNQVAEIIKRAEEDFTVLSGDDALTLPLIALGAKGCISVVANEVPREFSELCKLALEGNFERAREIHYRLLGLMRVNFIETNPIPVKTALSMMGMIKENFRLPLCKITPKSKEVLKERLRELGLI